MKHPVVWYVTNPLRPSTMAFIQVPRWLSDMKYRCHHYTNDVVLLRCCVTVVCNVLTGICSHLIQVRYTNLSVKHPGNLFVNGQHTRDVTAHANLRIATFD